MGEKHPNQRDPQADSGCVPPVAATGSTAAQAIRIVIQHIQNKSSYRLCAYTSNCAYRPVEFRSLTRLLATLRAAIPDFDQRALFIQEPFRDSYILYAGNFELSDQQKAILGVSDGFNPMG
ncbi:MAG: hypothetical protein WAK29_05380 [Terriglobales bacterium]